MNPEKQTGTAREQKADTGPAAGVIIILLVIIVGGIYFFWRTQTKATAPIEETPADETFDQSGDSATVTEAELNAEISGIESDMSEVEQEFDEEGW